MMIAVGLALVLAMTLGACGGDSAEDSSAAPTTAATDATDEPDAGTEGEANESATPELALRELADLVAPAGFACGEPTVNEEPDPANLYAASMGCETSAAFEVAVYVDDPDPSVGEPCSIDDTPFIPGEDAWVGYLSSGRFSVKAAFLPSRAGAPGNVVSTLESWAEAAGWDAQPTCAPPV